MPEYAEVDDTLEGRTDEELGILRQAGSLTFDERHVIKDDCAWVVAYVNSLSKKEQDNIGRAFCALSLGHYNLLQQTEWFETEKNELRARFGREPTEEEVGEDCAKHRNSPRFKLCYIIKHPDKVTIVEDIYKMFKPQVDKFLAIAQKLHPQSLPYADRIPIKTPAELGFA